MLGPAVSDHLLLLLLLLLLLCVAIRAALQS
jgi:hypothetical protein